MSVLTGRSICVVGAGGAVAGILYDLLQQKPASLTLFNRTVERATLLADRFSQLGTIKAESLDGIDGTEPFDLVINAISTGHYRQQPVLATGLFGVESCCYDLSYGTAHELTKAWCTENKIQCLDGLGMLVEQAAESFRIWTDFVPDAKSVLKALKT